MYKKTMKFGQENGNYMGEINEKEKKVFIEKNEDIHVTKE